MLRRSTLATLLALASTANPTEARQDPTPSTGRAYKVAFWYELARPFSSVQYRAYDLAKGEYNEAAANRWRRTIFANHPGFGATIRDLSTVGEPGATEAERLASAVEREKHRWVALNRRPSRPVPDLVGPTPTIRPRDPGVSRASLDRLAPGSPGPIANPPASPFPYPYRSGPR